jgi:hypothetical protein
VFGGFGGVRGVDRFWSCAGGEGLRLVGYHRVVFGEEDEEGKGDALGVRRVECSWPCSQRSIKDWGVPVLCMPAMTSARV